MAEEKLIEKAKTVREALQEGTLLFDGAMGTYFSLRERVPGKGCEMADIEKPEEVLAIHREYLEAGCRAIKTNTFAANRFLMDSEETVEDVIRAGSRLAMEAAEDYGAFVFADIGPVSGSEKDLIAEEYIWLSDLFLSENVTNFLFETNAAADGLLEAAGHIREVCPDAFLIASFAPLADGFTRSGMFIEDALMLIAKSGLFDAAGINCICGAGQMQEMLAGISLPDISLSVMPNAGNPIVISNRTFYNSDPLYFGQVLAEIAASGASIVGGCCGTTPGHIAAAYRMLQEEQTPVRHRRRKREPVWKEEISPLAEKLQSGKKVIAVELDPPVDSDVHWYLQEAALMRNAGADVITIADCPTARARMDASLLACRLKRELGMDVLPHMTCRDRNLNATKALLLGLSAEGIRNILLVTGDPIPSAERDEVKSVYQFNSRLLASFVSGLGEKGITAPFHIFGALNVNAHNFAVQLDLAKQKLQNGMSGFLTQPVLSEEALSNLRLARKELDGWILGGIMPVVSERNALFLESEVHGVHVAGEVIERYHGLSRDEAEDLAVEISLEFAGKMAPYTDGYYIMTPFERVEIVNRILHALGDMQEM